MFALAALTDSWSTGLVGGIYRWVAMCYGLVRELSTCVNLDDLNLDSFGNAIYTLVGIFMLFRLAISLINALINPNKIHDGKTGVGKILTRIMVSLVLVLAGPLIFNLLFDIQEAIVSPESSASILNLFGNNHSSINMFPVDDNSNEESLGDINQPTVDKDNNEVTPYEKVLPDSQQEGRETFTCYYALVDLNISRNSSGSGSAALNFNDVVGVTFTKNSSYSNAQGFKCIYNGLFGGCADSGAGAGWNTKFFGPTLISNSGTVYDSSDLKFDNFQTRYGAWDDKNSGAVVDSYNCNNLLYNINYNNDTISASEALWNNDRNGSFGTEYFITHYITQVPAGESKTFPALIFGSKNIDELAARVLSLDIDFKVGGLAASVVISPTFAGGVSEDELYDDGRVSISSINTDIEAVDLSFAQSLASAFVEKTDKFDEETDSAVLDLFVVNSTTDQAVADLWTDKKINLNWFMAAIMGIVAIIYLIVIAIDVVVRNFKLIILQLISPVAFISYINPEDKIFDNWKSQYIGAYLDLFLKLLALNLGMYACSQFISLLRAHDVTNVVAFIAVLLGGWTFIKVAPNFISKIFGIKEMAGTLKDSFNTLKTAIGAGAGFVIGGAMGAVSGLGAGGTIGTLATGAVGGAVSGLLSGRKGKIFEGGQKQVQRSKATREANLAGSTALGRMRARVGSALGVSAYDNDQRIVNAYEDLSKQHKAYDSHIEGEILKKDYFGMQQDRKELDYIERTGRDYSGRRYTRQEIADKNKAYADKLDLAKAYYTAGLSWGDNKGINDDVVAQNMKRTYDISLDSYKSKYGEFSRVDENGKPIFNSLSVNDKDIKKTLENSSEARQNLNSYVDSKVHEDNVELSNMRDSINSFSQRDPNTLTNDERSNLRNLQRQYQEALDRATSDYTTYQDSLMQSNPTAADTRYVELKGLVNNENLFDAHRLVSESPSVVKRNLDTYVNLKVHEGNAELSSMRDSINSFSQRDPNTLTDIDRSNLQNLQRQYQEALDRATSDYIANQDRLMQNNPTVADTQYVELKGDLDLATKIENTAKTTRANYKSVKKSRENAQSNFTSSTSFFKHKINAESINKKGK